MPKSYVLVTMEIEDSQSPDTLRFGTGQTALQRLEEVIIRAKSNQPRVRVGYCPLTSDATTFTVTTIGAGTSGTPSEAAYFPVGKQYA